MSRPLPGSRGLPSARWALGVGFGVLTAVLVGFGGLIAHELRTLRGVLHERQHLAVPRAMIARRLETGVLTYTTAIRGFGQSGDPTLRQDAEAAASALDQTFAQYRQLATEGNEREIASRFAAAWRDFYALGTELATAGPNATLDEWRRLAEAQRTIQSLLNQWLQPEADARREALADLSLHNVQRLLTTALLLLLGGGTISVVTGLGVGRRVLRAERSEAARAARLASFLENPAVFASLKDEGGRYLFVTPNHGSRFGRPPAEWVGRTDTDVWPAATARAIRRDDEMALRGDGPVERVERLTTPEGQDFWAVRTTVAIDDEGARRIATVAVDVTDLKATEHALRHSEARLALALRTGGMGWWEWDPDTGDMSWSPECGDILGVAASATPASHAAWMARVHPDDRPSVGRKLDKARHTGDALHVEYRIVQPGGQVRWVEARARALDAPGGPIRLLGVLSDITGRRDAEARLRESELRFGQFAEVIDEVFWISEPEVPRVVYCSPAYERLWGRPVTGVLARFDEWLDAVHPDDRDGPRAALRRALAEGNYDVEYRVIRPDGGVSWVQDRGFSLPTSPGRPRRFVGVARDVTERKRADAALIDRNLLLTSILQATSDAVFVKDVEGRCLLVNDAAAHALGLTPDAMIGKADAEIMPPSLARAVRANDLQVLAAGGTRTFEERLTMDGETRVFHAVKAPLHDALGRVTGLVGVARDITDRTRAEAALRDSEARLRVALAELEGTYRMAPVGLCVLDRELRFVRINDRLAEINGIPVAAHIGRTIREVVPDLADELEPLARLVFSTGEPLRNYEIKGQTATEAGRQQVWLEHWFPLTNGAGETTGINVVVEDVTAERKSAEELQRALMELQEANSRKDEFLAMLAHELRNPLAPILNAVQLLQAIGPAEPPLQTARDIIVRQVQHMGRLIDDLLDVSRITRGKISLQKEVLDLAEVVEAAVEASHPSVDDRGHSLSVHSARGVTVEADRARLTQVITNLLTNAAKFTPRGGHISVGMAREPEGVVLRVRDTGVGIAPEAQHRVFDLFTQEDTSLARSHGGLGIGLTLVKRLVALHGGSVSVTSDGAGRGSEFRIVLPAATGPVAAGGAVSSTPQAGARALLILVVEDNADAAESFRMLLQLGGHDVRVARDGVEALRCVDELDPDVAFIDLGLPGIDGFGVARHVRAAHTRRRTLLVAVSGYGRTEDRLRAREAGFDDHITKPADYDRVQALLARATPPSGEEADRAYVRDSEPTEL